MLEHAEALDSSDIPSIELYMDQVTTFMDRHLSSGKRHEEDKILTKTMINNYTKNDLLPSPTKKKYSADHILLLIFIYYFKGFLSISDIQVLLKPLTEDYFGSPDGELKKIYDTIFDSLYKDQTENLLNDLTKKFQTATDLFPGEDDKDQKLQLFAFICYLSLDVYLKKRLVETIIDEMSSDKKESKK